MTNNATLLAPDDYVTISRVELSRIIKERDELREQFRLITRELQKLLAEVRARNYGG